MRTCKKYLSVALALAVLFCLALVGGCGVKVTKTETHDQATGKVIQTVTVTEGSVEGQAAMQQGTAIPVVMKGLAQLVASVTIPRGYSKDGTPLEPAIVRMPDSRTYDVLIAMLDFSKFESPAVKLAGQFWKTVRTVGPTGLMVWGLESIASKMGNTTNTNTNYKASVNGTQNTLALTPGSGNTLTASPVSKVTHGDLSPVGDGNKGNVDNSTQETNQNESD